MIIRMNDNHIEMMELALNEARMAGQYQEVPIGAVIVSKTGEILRSQIGMAILMTFHNATPVPVKNAHSLDGAT